MTARSKIVVLTDASRVTERRAYSRLRFKGTAYAVEVGSKECQIRLRDLSCGGASGLIEEPLAIGDYLLIAFDERHRVEARVCWTRRVMVGVKFTNLLSTAFVNHLHERAAETRAQEDDQDRWAGQRLP